MRSKKLAILSICLLAALASVGGLKETYVEEYIPEVSERVECTYQEAIEIDLDFDIEDKNDAYFEDAERNVDVFYAEVAADSIDDDSDVPFSTSLSFQWWWIVIIVGTIALIFFIGWLIFFIWDRKDKKKYKKKQQK
ncbi:MAG: hypothetical protein LUD22_02215 [Coprobacillus sp.]|nr:hypothetical protein [Coprobacillus sp.]